MRLLALLLSSLALSAEPVPAARSGFVLRSPVITEGGAIPREFTGDGAGLSPPLEWSGAPAGTRCLALVMHHIPHPGEPARWYWTVWGIPAEARSLAKGAKGVGISGTNCVNRVLGYAPPHSKGPGVKKYTLTLYALSSPPDLKVPPSQVTRDVLLAAIQDRTLAAAELNFTYDRTDLAGADEGGSRPPPSRPRR
jgi:phosphatidylethanolamine-binding protein (PEBP) family uncharacterized protein